LQIIGSRPISGPLGYIGAHTYIGVIPDNSATIGGIQGIDTSRPFTLGGYTNGNGLLYKQANEALDYSYGFGGNTVGSAFAVVNPPPGVSSEEFDRMIVESYNALPSNISNRYDPLGQSRLTRNPNSNNVSTSILRGAGVSQFEIGNYQYQLTASNLKAIPGLGQSLPGSSSGGGLSGSTQITSSNLSAVISLIKSFIK
jgi:hypothetical protein